MKKVLIKSILTVLTVGFVYFVFDSFQTETAEADSEENVSGFAWSENIGWISFNNTTGGGGVDYGVNIESDDNLTGYAWSENIGWIDFNPSGPYPAPPDYSAKLDLNTKKFSGWARALAFNNDGWDGWIKLAGSNYEVWLDDSVSPSEFKGWAWGSDVLGWISFNCENQSVCAASNYKVVVSSPPPPPPPPPCVPNCACASSVCRGRTCPDGCGGTCEGTRDCSWKELAP